MKSHAITVFWQVISNDRSTRVLDLELWELSKIKQGKWWKTFCIPCILPGWKQLFYQDCFPWTLLFLSRLSPRSLRHLMNFHGQITHKTLVSRVIMNISWTQLTLREVSPMTCLYSSYSRPRFGSKDLNWF